MSVVQLPAGAEFIDRAAVHGAHVGGVPCKECTRVQIGRGVAYVYSTTRVVRALIYGYYACTAAHTCSRSICAVVSNSGASILLVYSTQHVLGGRYCSRTGVRCVPLRS